MTSATVSLSLGHFYFFLSSADNHETIVCCIYHKPRAMNESSSESDSDPSSSSSEIDSDTSDIDVDGRRRQQQQQQRSHNDSHGENGAATTHADGHSHGCNDLEPSSHHHHIKTPSRKPKRKSKKRKPSPNAYERVSKNVKWPYWEGSRNRLFIILSLVFSFINFSNSRTRATTDKILSCQITRLTFIITNVTHCLTLWK